MKKRLNYLLIVLCLLIASACKNGAVTADSGKDEGAGGREGEKAKAILWVDYKKGRPIPRGVAIKTVKVRAKVFADGSVKVLSFCKKQSFRVEDYLLKRLKVYRIRDWAFEGNYIQAGEQYLQLRYIPSWMK